MSPQFFEAWFNTDHKVLGRWLHPFCLEDALILSVAESPFLMEVGPEVQYELTDLQLAVSVCSNPGKVFLNAKFNRSWWSQLRTVCWGARCRRWCATETGLRQECQKFANYLDDYYSTPEVWSNEDRPKLKAPWILNNVVYLLRNTTYDERAIWTMPIGQALWIAGSIAEQVNPDVQIADEDEVAGMKEMGVL